MRWTQLIVVAAFTPLACSAAPDPGDAANAADAATTPDAAAADAGSPPSVSATVRPNPDNAVSAIVEVSVQGATSLSVHANDGTTTASTTPELLVTGPRMTVPLLGLAPGATHDVVVTVRAADGRTAQSVPVTVTLPPLPATIPRVTVTTNATSAQDALLLSVLCFDTHVSAAEIIDRNGLLQWYRLGGPPSTLGFEFQQRSNGHLVIYQVGGHLFEELDLTSTVRGSWALQGSPLGLDGHDIGFQSDGSAMVVGVGNHMDDTRPYSSMGRAETAVMDLTLHQLSAMGVDRAFWSSWPAISLAETTSEVFTPFVEPVDAIHPNSIESLPDGNLLVSLRHTDEVLKIDPRTGQLLWRLGGVRSDFTFVNDPLGRFSHQHDVRMLPNGDLQMFDNGNLHVPPASRVVEYRLDEAARTATWVSEYQPTPAMYNSAGGSARRAADGSLLIAWGLLGRVTELDATNRTRWAATAGNCMVYRAELTPSLYLGSTVYTP